MANPAQQNVKATTEISDPLLECLAIVTQIKHRPYSAESLRAGLPLKGNRVTPEVFIRAAQRAGFSSRLVKRSLKKFSPLLLPVVLMTKDGKACVLTKIYKNGTADVIFPEMTEGASQVSLADLEEQYTGYAFLVQLLHDFESRARDQLRVYRHKHWFWGTLWQFKRYYSQVIMASLFINFFALASPLFIMNVYDRVVPNNAVETLWVLAIGAAIVFGFDFILRTLRGFFIDFASKKVDVILGSLLFQQVLGLKMAARPKSTGVQANQLRDFENIRDFFTSATIASLVDLPFVLIFIWIIALIGGWLAVIPGIAAPIIIVSAILISIPLQRVVAESFVGSAQKHAILIESLNNLEVLKSLNAEGATLGRWEKYVGITADAGLKSRFYSMLAMNITTVVTLMTTVSVVVAGVYLIEARELSVGGLIACTILSGRCLAPLGQVTSLLTRYQLTKFSLKALDDIMHSPVERPERRKFLHRPTFDGEIVFENVNFKYPGQETDLLRDVSFTIKPGEKVGLLGSMGSGKTTIHNLIMNFYEADTGAIRIDGTDIANIDPADLRRNIGYVQQDAKLFFGTVRDNISMRAPWADDEDILSAAKASGAYNFIGKHPSGFDMPVGENGAGLSGGQIQAITVSRAVLMSPSILLLDEPTSSMDNSAEQLFMRCMDNELKDKTVLLVTHKMSLLTMVDRLMVLQNGRIIADGAKEQVLAMLQKLHADRQEQEA